MREALSALTTRGRGFLAAGVTTLVCAIILDLPALSSVGVLLIAVPLLTALVMARSRYRLALVRTVEPQVVTAGHQAQVQLTLSNEGRAPTGILLLEDQVPYALGSRPRFVLEGVGHGWRRSVQYPVRPELRGRYEIGPMSVRVTDPFGLVELGRTFHTTATLTATPRVQELPTIPVGGAWSGSGDHRPRSFATGSAEDVTVREYRHGDELRRVHWRSSARVGSLMVRREEQPWQSRATVFIDNRLVAHVGQGPSSSLETAVHMAASVAVHLSRRGFTVRLVTAPGEGPDSGWHFRDAELNTGALLEQLAVLGPSPLPLLDTDWLADATQGGLVVGVFGALTPADTAAARRLRHHSSSAMAIDLDVAAWGGRAPGARGGVDALAVLGSTGWRAVSMGPTDRADSVWEELGRLVARGARKAVTAGAVR